MRILHVSESGLPDWRIEKSALTGIKNNHEVFFAGNMVSPEYKNSIFSSIHYVPWTPKAMMGLPFNWHKVSKKYSAILKDINPDIIHAHNIFSAKLASNFDTPFVYDDHEYWSKYAIIAKETRNDKLRHKSYSNAFTKYMSNVKSYLVNLKIIRTWTKWEKDVVSKYPTITIDKTLARILQSKYNSSRIFVVPNYPTNDEVRDISHPKFHDRISCVYVGLDKTGHFKKRDMSGIRSVFNDNNIGTLTLIGPGEPEVSQKIILTGFLPRKQMFEELSRHSIGLFPWKKHWSHWYLGPNKAYEYAHAGLLVFSISSLRTVAQDLGEYCVEFEDIDDLVSKLTFYGQDMNTLYEKRVKAFEFARKNLLWDNYEANIIESYKIS